MSTYDSLRAQIEAHEAEEARLLAQVAALTAHAEATRRRVLEEVIDLLDTRAVQRSAQVDVAQAAGGAWEVVAGKSTELMAVADLLRARLPPSAGSATN